MKKRLTEGQRMAQKRRAGKIRRKLGESGVNLFTAQNKIRSSWARARA